MESEMERMVVQRRRAGNAVMAVVIAVMSLVAACAFSSSAQADAEEEPLAAQVWECIRRGSDMSNALGAVGLSAVDQSALPAWFREEVFSPQRHWDVWANEDWSVVGMSSNESASAARIWMEGQLKGNGWELCPSGMDDTATYMKEGGSCRWIAAQFSTTEDSTEAVLRILRG